MSVFVCFPFLREWKLIFPYTFLKELDNKLWISQNNKNPIFLVTAFTRSFIIQERDDREYRLQDFFVEKNFVLFNRNNHHISSTVFHKSQRYQHSLYHSELSTKAQIHNSFRIGPMKHHSHIQLRGNTFYDIFQYIHLSNWTHLQELLLNGELRGKGHHDTPKDSNPTTGNCFMHKINNNRGVHGSFPYQCCFTSCNHFLSEVRLEMDLKHKYSWT